MNIVWKSYSNPSPYRDAAYSSCILGNTVFSTGFDEAMGYGRQRFRVESRSIRDGYVHGTWVDNDSHSFSSLYSCLVSKDMVYTVGATERFWSIIVFDRYLNVVNRRDFDKPLFIPFSMAGDGENIYIAGIGGVGVGTGITVLKVSHDDLSIEATYSSMPMDKPSGAYSIAYNYANKSVVVGGFDRVDGVYRWRIEILDNNLNPVKMVRMGVGGAVTGVSIGVDGDIYAIGRNGIARLSKDGDIVMENRSLGGIEIFSSQRFGTSIGRNIVAIDNNWVYLLGEDLSIVERLRIAGGGESIAFLHGAPAFDGSKLCVSGIKIDLRGDWSWVVMAINPKRLRKLFQFWT